jgi:predicted nucleic acid-binding protein
MVSSHSRFESALPWLRKAVAGDLEMLVSTHTLAEVFAILTRLPLKPKIQPAMAWRLIRENVEQHAGLVALTGADYKAVLQSQAELGLEGGRIYDALIAKAAQKSDADWLLTLNRKDFASVWPGAGDKIREP